MPEETARIDKWLWAVRLFKTRTLAAENCRDGAILIGDQRVKPSRDVRVGDVITVKMEGMSKTVKVLAALDKRVGAKLVEQYAEDLTPASEYLKLLEKPVLSGLKRPPGAGRPTKKERRDMEKLF